MKTNIKELEEKEIGQDIPFDVNASGADIHANSPVRFTELDSVAERVWVLKRKKECSEQNVMKLRRVIEEMEHSKKGTQKLKRQLQSEIDRLNNIKADYEEASKRLLYMQNAKAPTHEEAREIIISGACMVREGFEKLSNVHDLLFQEELETGFGCILRSIVDGYRDRDKRSGDSQKNAINTLEQLAQKWCIPGDVDAGMTESENELTNAENSDMEE